MASETGTVPISLCHTTAPPTISPKANTPHQPGKIFLVGHIAGHRRGLADVSLDALGNRLCSIGIAVTDHDRGTGCRKGFGNRATDTGACTRDDGNLLMQCEVGCVVHLGFPCKRQSPPRLGWMNTSGCGCEIVSESTGEGVGMRCGAGVANVHRQAADALTATRAARGLWPAPLLPLCRPPARSPQTAGCRIRHRPTHAAPEVRYLRHQSGS